MGDNDWLIFELDQIVEYASTNHILNFIHLIQAAKAQLVTQREAATLLPFVEMGPSNPAANGNILPFRSANHRSSSSAT